MTNLRELTIQRFKQIREEQRCTQSDFAKLLGINNSTADIERGKTKISGEIVSKLLKEFQVNPLWLFGESSQKNLNLKSADVSPKVVTVDMDDNENMVLVNIKATAGYPQHVQDVDWYQQLPAFDIPLPEFRNATYRGFQIEGDSMLPALEPKEWVIGKAVDNLSEVTDSAIYVVVLQDSVVVKKIRRSKSADSKLASKISLISINPDYAPYSVSIDEIIELWEVNSKLSFNIDTPVETAGIKQLQDAIANLTSEIQGLKA